MPRVTRVAIPLGAAGYPDLPLAANAADVPLTASDAVNFEQVVHAANVIIVARNSGAGARTITVTSAPYLGRSGDITGYSIGAGEFAILGPFPAAGWRQANGFLYWQAEHAEVLTACVLLP